MSQYDEPAPFSDPIHASAQVSPGGRRRAAMMLLVATFFASIVCAAVFFAVLHADFLNAPAEGVMKFLFKNASVAMLLACSPLFAAMLVGYGYMQRALRRRSAAKAAKA
jgi:hypothetical protein